MIAVEDLYFRYTENQSWVLRGVHLTLQEGQSVSIMGANGSGKTTFARCLNGLLVPVRGRVTVDGLDTSRPGDRDQIPERVGMVFQNPDNQIVATTVEREIAFGMENRSVPPEEMHRRVDELLKEFGLERYRHRSPHYLSGGEKQLLALAAVLATRPRYLILDEPTSLLDPFNRKRLLEQIFRSSNGWCKGITPVLITQFPEETFFTERLIVFSEGHVLLDGPPAEVFRQADLLKHHGLAVPVEFELDLGELHG